MKRKVVRTVGTLALALSVAGVAQAQWRHCAIRGLEGSWSYTETGTIVSPQTGAALAVMAVGRYTFDRDGTFTGIQWTSTAGQPPGVYGTKNGTFTVDEDTCTITMQINGYDKNGNLIRESVWQIVLADNGKEMRGISLSLLFAPGNPPPKPPDVDLKPVMTMTGTRISSSDEGREEREQPERR
jgi:hypothetical protein